MPSAKTHKTVSLSYLGQYTPWLQHILDFPASGELKSHHRLLFHDLDFILYLEERFGRDIAREALLHIILDIEHYRPIEKKRISYD